MKNAAVFVDVDLTLVDHNQNLIPGAREALQRLVERGCHLFLWSTAGKQYAESTAARHELTHLFDGFVGKPDILIDDMPGSVLNAHVFNPNEEGSWDSMVDSILDRHIDEAPMKRPSDFRR